MRRGVVRTPSMGAVSATLIRLVPGLVLAAFLAGASCSPPPTPFPEPAATERAAERQDAARLGPGDVFDVRVFGEKALSGRYRVSPEGTIVMPLIRTISVVGMTPVELSDLLADRLRDGYLREPHVTVFVQEYNSKRVFVIGAVQKPGTFTFEENMTVVQAVTLAGGFKDLADQNGTVVTRLVGGEKKRYVVPVEAITRGDRANFPLHPGDIVYVPDSIL